MRKLTVIEFITLDGVMQSLGSAEEDTSGGFRHGGWSASYGDEVLGRRAGEGLGRTGAYLFGRKTYEHMAAHWPHVPDDDPMAADLNATPKYVVSNTLDQPEWQPTTVLGDIADVGDLKRDGEENIAVLGSGLLVQGLLEAGLVDSFTLFVHPLVLGSGKTLFRSYDEPIRLRLSQSQPTTTGVLILEYDVET